MPGDVSVFLFDLVSIELPRDPAAVAYVGTDLDEGSTGDACTFLLRVFDPVPLLGLLNFVKSNFMMSLRRFFISSLFWSFDWLMIPLPSR